MKFMLSLWAVSLCLISLCQSMDRSRNKICYKAMTCIHTGREKCGVDHKGNYRRFYDSCDILEYNCLKGTSYVKTSKERCDDLPPLENGRPTSEKENNNNNVNMNVNNGVKESKGTVNIDDEGIEGEIEVDDDLITGQSDKGINEAGGTATINGDGIEGEVIVDDNGSIEGTIEINDDLAGGNLNNYSGGQPKIDPNKSEIEGEIEVDDEQAEQDPEGDYVEGEIEISEDDLIENKDIGKNLEGEVVIDDDGNVEASLELATDDDGNQGAKQWKEAEEKPVSYQSDDNVGDIQADIEINDENIHGEIQLNDEEEANQPTIHTADYPKY